MHYVYQTSKDVDEMLPVFRYIFRNEKLHFETRSTMAAKLNDGETEYVGYHRLILGRVSSNHSCHPSPSIPNLWVFDSDSAPIPKGSQRFCCFARKMTISSYIVACE